VEHSTQHGEDGQELAALVITLGWGATAGGAIRMLWRAEGSPDGLIETQLQTRLCPLLCGTLYQLQAWITFEVKREMCVWELWKCK
jgi:hypothetical protein